MVFRTIFVFCSTLCALFVSPTYAEGMCKNQDNVLAHEIWGSWNLSEEVTRMLIPDYKLDDMFGPLFAVRTFSPITKSKKSDELLTRLSENECAYAFGILDYPRAELDEEEKLTIAIVAKDGIAMIAALNEKSSELVYWPAFLVQGEEPSKDILYMGYEISFEGFRRSN